MTLKTLLSTIATMVVSPVLYYGGMAMNALVMAVNGGQMPVLWPGGCGSPSWNQAEDEFHVCMTAATHLRFLADWIVLHIGVASPGDMLIFLGDALWYPLWYIGVGLLIAQLWRQQCPQQQPLNFISTRIGRRKSLRLRQPDFRQLLAPKAHVTSKGWRRTSHGL